VPRTDGSGGRGLFEANPLLWMLVKKMAPEWLGGLKRPRQNQLIPEEAKQAIIVEFTKVLPDFKYGEVAHVTLRLLEMWFVEAGYEIRQVEERP